MDIKSILVGSAAAGALAGVAGCGSTSSTSPTPSPAPKGITLPGGITIPGSSSNSGPASAPPANTILTLQSVQSISGDPNVAAVGTCAAICTYRDPAEGGGGSGVIIIEQIPGGLSQGLLQAAVIGALSGNSSGGGNAQPVSGLGSAALKEIDSDSATYAFSKDDFIVIMSVTSVTNAGASMDAQVQALAQSAAGQL